MNTQVANAVQNTLKAEKESKELELLRKVHPNLAKIADSKATDPVLPESELSKDAKKEACKAADEAYQLQCGKDGINELTKKIKALDDRLNEKVYAIAKIAYTECEGVLNVAKVYFQTLCGYAEKHIVAKHTKATREVKSMAELMPSWSTYKSDIAKGLGFGIDPEEMSDEDAPLYATAAAYMKAVKEKVAADKAAESGTGAQGTGQRSTKTEQEKALSVISSGWDENVRAAVQVVNQALNRLTESDQKLFIPALLALGGAIDKFADIRLKGTTLPGNVTLEQLPPDVKAAMQAAIDNATKVEGSNMTAEEHGQVVATELARAASAKDERKGKAGAKVSAA